MLLYLPLGLTWAALALHLLGERRAAIVTGRPRDRGARSRALSFYAGLLTVFVALATPIDSLSQKLFWIHMLQHVLLLTVAAPLIVLGAPWMSIWRPLPLGMRRMLAKTVARSRACAPLRAVARVARTTAAERGSRSTSTSSCGTSRPPTTSPCAATPCTPSSTSPFILFGVLLWAQVLESPPLRVRLSRVHGVYYITGSLIVGWLLSLVLAFATTPLYPYYAHLAHRPGGISALTDQQLAGGMMLGPGSLAMTLYVFIELYRWLGQDEDGGRARRRRAGSAARSAPS